MRLVMVAQARREKRAKRDGQSIAKWSLRPRLIEAREITNCVKLHKKAVLDTVTPVHLPREHLRDIATATSYTPSTTTAPSGSPMTFGGFGGKVGSGAFLGPLYSLAIPAAAMQYARQLSAQYTLKAAESRKDGEVDIIFPPTLTKEGE